MRVKKLKSSEYYILHELKNELQSKIDKSKELVKSSDYNFETRKRDQEQIRVLTLQEILELINDLEDEIKNMVRK